LYFNASSRTRLLTARRNQIGEYIGIFAIIVAVRKLVQVERQIILADVMKAAHDAALQERPKAFDIVGVDLAAHVLALPVADYFVRHAGRFEQAIASVFVGRNEAHAIANRLSDEPIKGSGIGILDYFCDDHALACDGSDHGDLAGETAGAFRALVLVPVIVLAADITFVHFNLTVQRESVALHRSAPAMAYVPTGSPVCAGILAEDDAPYLERAKSLLGSKHQVADLESCAQRDLSILKDSVSDDTESVAFASTAIGIAATPVERARLQCVDLLTGITARTTHAIRPAFRCNVRFASFIGRKLTVELFKGQHGQILAQIMDDCQLQLNRSRQKVRSVES
jgi:hypothetical protein